MALPSQIARPVSRRTYTHRRSRRRRSRAIFFFVAVVFVTALVAWWLWSKRDASTEIAPDDAPKAPVAANVTTTTRGQGEKARSAETVKPTPSSRDASRGDSRAATKRGTAPPPGSNPKPGDEAAPPAAIEMGGAAHDRAAKTVPPAAAVQPTPEKTAAAPPIDPPITPPVTTQATSPGTAPLTSPAAKPAGAETAGGQTAAEPAPFIASEPARDANAPPPAARDVKASAPAARDAKPSPANARAQEQVRVALELLAHNEPVEARLLLTRALDVQALAEADDEMVRDRLAALNQRLVFGPDPSPEDPWVEWHEVASGESLSAIQRSLGVHTEWQFIQRVNRISRPERIGVGQKLKIVTGPFHAVIRKRAYRLDLYLGDGPDRVFVCSMPVGLGENDSTPQGRFRVRPRSKLENPEWINPRTRERFASNDPQNPIGERWIGLIGDEEHLSNVEGYGIHGTIEPDSIGRQASMGCVRMLPDDIAVIYEVLIEKMSTIEIRP